MNTEKADAPSNSSGDSLSSVPNGCTGCGKIIPDPAKGWCSIECMNQDIMEHLTRWGRFLPSKEKYARTETDTDNTA